MNQLHLLIALTYTVIAGGVAFAAPIGMSEIEMTQLYASNQDTNGACREYVVLSGARRASKSSLTRRPWRWTATARQVRSPAPNLGGKRVAKAISSGVKVTTSNSV